ncbi:hypothetical protein Hanom_Chr12g01102891 [Helianthus anomalus]
MKVMLHIIISQSMKMRFESVVASFLTNVFALALISSMVTRTTPTSIGVAAIQSPPPPLPSSSPPPPMATGSWGGCWACWDKPDSNKKNCGFDYYCH